MTSKVNSYISNYDNVQISEQGLNDQLVIEIIQNWGQTFHYIPRTMIEEDKIWGEDKDALFEKATEIEMLVETIDGFGGDGDLMSMYGMEINDEAVISVSKTRWKEEFPDYDFPKEGDLLYYPMTKGLFQINYVAHREPFFQLGKNYTFKLKVARFEYGFENMDTGITEVDNLNDIFNYDNLNDFVNVEPIYNNDKDVIKEKAEELKYWDKSGDFLD